MKIPVQITLVACTTAGILLGVLIGRGTAPSGAAASSLITSGGLATGQPDGASRRNALEHQDRNRLASTESEFQPVQSGRGAVAQIEMALKGTHRTSTLLRIMGTMAHLQKDEIPEVIELAQRQDGEEGEWVLACAVTRWAELDPKSAAEWVSSHKDGAGQFLEDALSEWAARDPRAAKAWIGRLDNKNQREAAMRGYFGGLAVNDPAAAFREISALPGDRNRKTYEAVFRTWAHKDPRAAGAQVALLTDPAAQKAASKEVARIWGATAPREALNWALQLSNEELKQDVARDTLARWAKREPQEAMAHLLTLPVQLRDEATPALIAVAANQNFDEAQRFAEQMPPGKGRDEAILTIANVLAGRDPRAAAEYARSLPPGKSLDNTYGSIARTWARTEPVATAQWVAQLPAGEGQVNATGVLVEGWARTDAKAAATWLEQQPAGPGRDAGAAAFAMQVRNSDPAAAMEWASVVEDTRQRERAVREVLESWQRKDPTAARTWIESTPVIDEALRSVLLRTP